MFFPPFWSYWNVSHVPFLFYKRTIWNSMPSIFCQWLQLKVSKKLTFKYFVLTPHNTLDPNKSTQIKRPYPYFIIHIKFPSSHRIVFTVLYQFIHSTPMLKDSVICCPVDCKVIMKVGCDVDNGLISLGSEVMGSFHWLSWTDTHLCSADQPSYFLPVVYAIFFILSLTGRVVFCIFYAFLKE